VNDRIVKAVKRCCPSVCASTAKRLEIDDAARTARVLKALGDETRLAIVASLARAGCAQCVCEIEPMFNLSQPTISHHLKVLRDAELVDTERRGTWVYYSLRRETIALVARFWEALTR